MIMVYQEDVFDHVKDHFCSRIERIGNLLVSGKFKLIHVDLKKIK